MKKVITEKEIIDLLQSGKTELIVDKNTILTPLALDKIRSAKINLVEKKPIKTAENVDANFKYDKTIAIGSDHTGFEIKEILKKFLESESYNVIDVGTYSKNSCDYPDFAIAVSKKIALKEAGFGVIIDATGIPSAITANKFPGIRAATCYNEFSARSSREHNDSNIIVFGAKTLGEETIKATLKVWLDTPFAGGRHQRRLNKITEIEKFFLVRK